MDSLLWAVTAALPLLVVVRLAQVRLLTRAPYDGLAAFCLTVTVTDILHFWLPTSTARYTDLWEATLPAVLCAHVFVCVRSYQAIVALYPKIGRWAHAVFLLCAGVAGLLTLIGVPWELAHIQGAESGVRIWILILHFTDGICGGALVLLVLYFSRYPKPLQTLPRNLLVHTTLITSYFVSYSLIALLKNFTSLTDATMQTVHRAHFGFIAALYVAWLFGVSRRGENAE